jgi:hypothetical protein
VLPVQSGDPPVPGSAFGGPASPQAIGVNNVVSPAVLPLLGIGLLAALGVGARRR